jgi:MerR family transcriptional regulator, mercuric resistance operon regulatory protein
MFPMATRTQRKPRKEGVSESMTIGRLAEAAGVNVETVRYYQRRGLLRAPRKPAGGQRRYAPEVLAQLGFIRHAQQLGFSLEEVKTLMELARAGDCGKARGLAQGKHEALGARVAQLNAMRRELKRLIEACRGQAPGRPCPFFERLWKAG